MVPMPAYQRWGCRVIEDEIIPKLISYRSGTCHDWIGLRLQFMVNTLIFMYKELTEVENIFV
jgi:hypothetical protein